MKDPLGVSPSKDNQGTTRGKEKFFLTSVGIEPTTSGLDLPLLCRLSYEVGQRKSETIYADICCSFFTWFGHDFPAGQFVSVRSYLIAATT